MSALKITIEITTVQQLCELRDALELHYDIQASQIDDLATQIRKLPREDRGAKLHEERRKLVAGQKATHDLRRAIDPEWTPRDPGRDRIE